MNGHRGYRLLQRLHQPPCRSEPGRSRNEQFQDGRESTAKLQSRPNREGLNRGGEGTEPDALYDRPSGLRRLNIESPRVHLARQRLVGGPERGALPPGQDLHRLDYLRPTELSQDSPRERLTAG